VERVSKGMRHAARHLAHLSEVLALLQGESLPLEGFEPGGHLVERGDRLAHLSTFARGHLRAEAPFPESPRGAGELDERARDPVRHERGRQEADGDDSQ